jgi:hypothetical protein
MAKRLGKQNLLKLHNGQVVAGDSLIVTALYYKDEDAASD